MRIASFDIGRKNFAQYVEQVEVGIFSLLKEKMKTFAPEEKKYSSDKMREIRERLCLGGKRLQAGVYNICESGKIDMETRRSLISHLDDFREMWLTVDVFVVEQQYCQRGNMANIGAIKLAEVTMTWLLANYPSKEVVSFGSKHKTQMFGAPKMKDNERKKWAEKESRRIYEAREDKEMMELFLLKDKIFRKRLTPEKVKEHMEMYEGNEKDLARKILNRQKLDDVSDAFLQCQAYKLKMIC